MKTVFPNTEDSQHERPECCSGVYPGKLPAVRYRTKLTILGILDSATSACTQRGSRLPSVDEPKQKLSRLTEEHLESLSKESFVRADDKQLEAHEKRLNDIREVSADYLAAMARTHSQIGSDSMTKSM